jgi:hypothetical protein
MFGSLTQFSKRLTQEWKLLEQNAQRIQNGFIILLKRYMAGRKKTPANAE